MRYKELYNEYNALLSMRNEHLTVLSTLKDGYISIKTISGKRYAYLQKKIEGRLRSEYIKEDILQQVKNELQKRKELEKSIIHTDGQLARLETAAAAIDKSLYRKFVILKRCSAMDSMSADMRKKSLAFGNAMTALESIPASENTEKSLSLWAEGRYSFEEGYLQILAKYNLIEE